MIEKGQKYEPSSEHDGKGMRVIEVVDVKPGSRHADVVSRCTATGRERRIRISVRRLASSAYKFFVAPAAAAAVAVLLALASGCAGAPAKPPCTDTAQWTSGDQSGQPIGIFVCFGKRGRLEYDVRRLPPAPPPPPAAPTPEQVLEAKRAAGRALPPAPPDAAPSSPVPDPAPATPTAPRTAVKKPRSQAPATLSTLGGTAR